MSLNMYPRKLVEKSPIFWSDPFPATAEAAAPNSTQQNTNLNKNVLFIISIIAFGVILSFIMICLVEYVIKCLSSASSEPTASPSASLGIKKEALEAFPVVTFSAEIKLSGQDTECLICLSEFVSGDQVRVLPKCNHGFHVACIDRWLGSHSTCPKCRHCLNNICEKIVEASPQSFLPAQGSTAPCAMAPGCETLIRINMSSS